MTAPSTPAGASPAAASATPAQSTPSSDPTSDPTPAAAAPATGDAELGEAGKRAIAAERQAAKDAQKRAEAAERELETLRTASQTDQEKALNAAKREAAAEERAKFETMLRRAGIRTELRSRGMSEGMAELALRDDRFATLKVDDGGRVADVDKAVDGFLKDFPEMVAPAGAAAGTVTAGAQTGAQPTPKDLEAALTAHYTKR